MNFAHVFRFRLVTFVIESTPPGTKDLGAKEERTNGRDEKKNPLFGPLFSFSLYWIVTPDSFGEVEVKLPNYCILILFTLGDIQSQKQRHLCPLSS